MQLAAVHAYTHAVAAHAVTPPAVPAVERAGRVERAEGDAAGRGGDAAGRAAAPGLGPAVVNHVAPVGSARAGARTHREAGTRHSGAVTTDVAAAEVSGAEVPQVEAQPPGGEAAVADSGGEAAVADSGGTPGAESGPAEEDAREEAAQAAADEEKLRELKARDTEVRVHEQAHVAAGGAYAGTPSFEFERGPDGRSYAVGGEVPIDVTPVSGDPQATIQKMAQVKRAALAPATPSSADRGVAASADARANEARRELSVEQTDAREAESSAPLEPSAEAGSSTEAGDAEQSGGVSGLESLAGATGAADPSQPAPGSGLAAAAERSFGDQSRRVAAFSAYASPVGLAGATVSVRS